MTTALDEARHRLDKSWRCLQSELESETGLRTGRRGWALLVLAFCGGVALAVRGRRGAGKAGDGPSL